MFRNACKGRGENMIFTLIYHDVDSHDDYEFILSLLDSLTVNMWQVWLWCMVNTLRTLHYRLLQRSVLI